MSNPLWKLGATETAELIAKKEVNVKAVIETHLERLQEINPKINAVTKSLNTQALSLIHI